MSDDLERAVGDLADAASHAAARGIFAQPAIEPTLHRIVHQVRRRRAARTTGVATLVLAVLVGTAGAVNGLERRTTATPVAPGPVVTSASPSPTPAPSSGAWRTACGANDEQLAALSDPTTHRPVAGITAPGVPPSAADAAPGLTITVDNVAAQTISLGASRPRVVVVREADHVIVGGGSFDTSSGPAEVGRSTDFSMTQPLWACSSAGAPAEDQPRSPLLSPGRYGLWVLVDTVPLAADGATTSMAGPFALTITDPSTTAVASPDDQFRCGQPLGFTATSLPAAGGLTLAADLPATGWVTGVMPNWSAALGAAGSDTVLANVNLNPHLVFTDARGVVVGRTVQGDLAVDLVTVGPGAPAHLTPASEAAACGANGDFGGAPGELPTFAPGAYTAWPFTTAVLKEVQHADGTADVPSSTPVLVVGPPVQVTFAG